jgi:hypothetical protein
MAEVEWPNSKPLKPLPWFAASVGLYLPFWHSLIWIGAPDFSGHYPLGIFCPR